VLVCGIWCKCECGWRTCTVVLADDAIAGVCRNSVSGSLLYTLNLQELHWELG
jgi:hypothetical protein